ncbi:MAG: hypothetical protein BWY73_01664 [candidate division TA06 bacterium ADurb.Bin417]|uniref:Uncharacterized protein n=1 Tax=candidate division TA06 bacterium ADurb.Bin417 TaxID=1852828 RepID=A0A1V5M5K4_UNCT6|nr:MAG: hypothetical protein BWY73_01664 [candidate division TA06 bacterium ADurb.Bin417]
MKLPPGVPAAGSNRELAMVKSSTYRFKIAGLGISEKQFAALPFGRKVEYFKKFEEFKASAKSTWVSQKRKTSTNAIKEFLDLHKPLSYFCSFQDSGEVRDDTFKVFYN